MRISRHQSSVRQPLSAGHAFVRVPRMSLFLRDFAPQRHVLNPSLRLIIFFKRSTLLHKLHIAENRGSELLRTNTAEAYSN